MWSKLWRVLGSAAGQTCGLASRQATHIRSAGRGLLAEFLQRTLDERHAPPLEDTRRQADRIAAILRERGIVPNRMGIDGLPGSGKSMLARALAPELNLRWISLDHTDLAAPRRLEKQRIIVEHHRLLRTQNADAFDVIIYIAETPQHARARTVWRGKGKTLTAAVLDYEKLGRIGELAFEVCAGEPLVIPESNLRMKIKPPGGFRALENIQARLHAAGLTDAGLSKEEALFLLVFGKPESGLAAYYTPYVCFAGLGGLTGWLTRTPSPQHPDGDD